MPLTDYTWEPPVIYAIITAAIGMASWPAYYFYKLWKVRNDKKAEQDKLKGV